MPRPKTKKELISLSQENYQKLNEYVDSFSLAEQLSEFPPGTMNRNIKDVLAHLHHWHLLLLRWYEVGMQGEKPVMPAEGYTWRDLPEYNEKIRELYSGVALEKVRKELQHSYQQVQDIIARHTDKELFEKKRYKWTGSTSLGAYLVSSTSSHYDWALKLIKKAKKNTGEPAV